MEHELKPEECKLLADFNSAIRDLQQQAQGAVRAMCCLRGITGNVSVENGKIVELEGTNG